MDGLSAATFDCYGTLIDWEGGLGAFLYRLALRKGEPAPQPGRVLRERWEELQFKLIQGPYMSYEDVLAESLREWAVERGYRCEPFDVLALGEAMRCWQPFPDTVPALRRARAAGLRLVIVSNSDHDIMRHTLRHLELEFDDVVLAEDVGVYKPSPLPLQTALERIGEPPERVLHVAFGFQYDIGPAKALGMRTAWVNRKREPRPDGVEPDLEWHDLWALAELAEAGVT